jgi:hypothetical protein
VCIYPDKKLKLFFFFFHFVSTLYNSQYSLISAGLVFDLGKTYARLKPVCLAVSK